jgi:hypothetical protein
MVNKNIRASKVRAVKNIPSKVPKAVKDTATDFEQAVAVSNASKRAFQNLISEFDNPSKLEEKAEVVSKKSYEEATVKANDIGQSVAGACESLKRDFEVAVEKVIMAGKLAIEISEESRKYFRKTAGKTEDAIESTKATIKALAKAYEESARRAEETALSAKHKAEESIRVSRGSIGRTEEASKAAREAAEQSIVAANKAAITSTSTSSH